VPKQRKYALAALFTVCICVLALYIHRHRQGKTGTIDNLLISAAAGMQKHFYYFSKGSRTIVDRYVLLVNAEKERDELFKEVAYLKTKVAALQEVELENNRLRESLRFGEKISEPLVAAHVIAHDASTDYFGIRIDKGKDDGVRPGMGVISPSGLVGRVLRTSAKYSDVLALVDPTSNIDAIIQRSRARGIISGQSKTLTCRLKYVDRAEDVAVNDLVVSSGFNSIFPKGLVIGYVSNVIPDPNGILQTVVVKSAVDIYRLEEVFIVLSPAEPPKTS
jgi:rod shape-determining protein MreC